MQWPSVKRLRVTNASVRGTSLEAAQYYTRSLEYRPAAALVLCNRAQARIKLKQFDFAIEDCDAALKQDASLLKAWVRRAHARSALGRFPEAVQDLETAAKLDEERGGDGSEIRPLLADATGQGGRKGQARRPKHPLRRRRSRSSKFVPFGVRRSSSRAISCTSQPRPASEDHRGGRCSRP